MKISLHAGGSGKLYANTIWRFRDQIQSMVKLITLQHLIISLQDVKYQYINLI